MTERQEVESENLRLLRKLLEIKSGKLVRVTRAGEWQKSPTTTSPLAKENGGFRLMASASKVMLENQRIAKILENANSSPTTNVAILKSNAKI